ncbi:MAG: hypothetical protein CMP95_06650 [Gammaproteobacteria bacterium]|nr:hypothetical protein [Gammaproteobacteria bacterium]
MDVNDKFHSFMKSFCAAVELQSRAAQQGCFLECVVLTAAIIDATLRIGLILKHQIETSSSNLLEDILCQGEQDKAFSERKIYKNSFGKGIIDEQTFNELNDLYGERNKVVHRYIISSITTLDMLRIAEQYDDLKHKVSNFVAVLEKEQIRLGVGMTVNGNGENLDKDINELARSKHGDDGLASALRECL